MAGQAWNEKKNLQRRLKLCPVSVVAAAEARQGKVWWITDVSKAEKAICAEKLLAKWEKSLFRIFFQLKIQVHSSSPAQSVLHYTVHYSFHSVSHFITFTLSAMWQRPQVQLETFPQCSSSVVSLQVRGMTFWSFCKVCLIRNGMKLFGMWRFALRSGTKSSYDVLKLYIVEKIVQYKHRFCSHKFIIII